MFGLFRKQKNVDAILDPREGHLAKIGGWVGNMKCTAEERAEMNAKLSEAVRKFAVATMGENTERSKARRGIAILWIKTQVALILCCVITIAAGDYERFDRLWMITSSTLMISGTGAVITFFFGAYYLNSYTEKKSDTK